MEPYNKPGARARYHSCLFTAISLDAEWTRRAHIEANHSPKSSMDDAFEAISSRCEGYKRRVEKNGAAQGLVRDDPDGKKQARWDCLYSPLEYVPLGHDDALSLVIFDDFDPFVNVTGQCPTTVEEMAVGYIPDLEHLAQGWREEDRIFIDRARLAMGKPEAVFSKGEELPALLVFSRFKVNGLGSLGMGSLQHVALMRALIRCLGQTLLQMESAAVSEGKEKSLMGTFEIGTKDLQATRFMMVDLLGQEELGLVYFVSNWSIAAAINSRIQCLKFEEVLSADGSGCFKEEFLSAEWYKTLCEFYSDIKDTENLEPNPNNAATVHEVLFEKIQHTHPLRWVRSTPAVQKKVFYQAPEGIPEGLVRGWIDATTHLRIAPGHQSRAQEATKCVGQKAGDEDGGLKMGAVFTCLDSLTKGVTKDDFTIHQLGASDLALPHADFNPSDPKRLVPVRDFLSRVYALMQIAGGNGDEFQGGINGQQKAAAERSRQRHGRLIVGANTFCGIPVPVLHGSDGSTILSPEYDDSKHWALLEIVLPVLKRRMMLSPCPVKTPNTADDPIEEDLRRYWAEWNSRLTRSGLREGRKMGENWGALAPSNICGHARKCGLPQTLIRTLEFVYHNFTTLLANPLAFDSVLDLYDIFASFHRVVTQELPRVCSESPLDKRRVDMIARLIDAVHRSLEHRMYRLFPENSNRDMDIDFRGGLNALVSSADGVLKLGVGVLRHHLLKEAQGDRARVGVVTRIGFRQGISANALRLGVESNARLGIVETDVPHLYHLPSYVDFLHEAFHLVYDAARNPGRKEGVTPMLPTVPRDSGDLTIEGRLAEIFANMLTTMFVCGDNPELLAEHMVIQYATRGMDETDPEIIGNLIELICHLYVVCQSIQYLKDSAKESNRSPWWFCGNDDEEEIIRCFQPKITGDGFSEFFFKLLPFFSSKLVKWAKDDNGLKRILDNQVRVIFTEVYESRLREFVPIVVAKVCLIYSRFWYRASGRLIAPKEYRERVWLKDNEPVSKRELEKLMTAWSNVKRQLEGEMSRIVEGHYEPFSFLAWRPDGGGEGRLDPMIPLGTVLGEILRARSKDLHGRDNRGPYHLPTKDGIVHFDDLDEVLNGAEKPKVYIQRGVSALFSSDLDYRAHRLGSRITVLKIFGDMASLLRSKRFSEMLVRNLSEPLN